MRIYTATITFDGGGAKFIANPSPTGSSGFYRMYVEPVDGNTHVAYVGDSLLAIATSTTNHVVKRLSPPSSATAILDHFEIYGEGIGNALRTEAFSFDGTNGEGVRVTLYEK